MRQTINMRKMHRECCTSAEEALDNLLKRDAASNAFLFANALRDFEAANKERDTLFTSGMSSDVELAQIFLQFKEDFFEGEDSGENDYLDFQAYCFERLCMTQELIDSNLLVKCDICDSFVRTEVATSSIGEKHQHVCLDCALSMTSGELKNFVLHGKK